MPEPLGTWFRLVKGVPPPTSLGMDSPEVVGNGSDRTATHSEPIQLGMEAIAPCLSTKQFLGQEGLPPQGDQPLLIEK
jgi:hypothetical protein